MKKKILIIGFGKMGLSHFRSLQKKNYVFHIIEKKKNLNFKKLEKDHLINKKFFIFSKLQKNQKYLLTICATESRSRFLAMKSFFLKKNITKFLLLEKFCFINLKEFENFNNHYARKSKVFVNSWAFVLCKLMRLTKKFKKLNIICHVRKGHLLSNITHICHFFDFFNQGKQLTYFKTLKAKIINNTKRKTYHELNGIVKMGNKNANITIQTKKIKSIIIFKITKNNSNRKVIININDKSIIYKTLNKIKKISKKNILSSNTTLKFLNESLLKKFSYMPSFKNDYHLSRIILKNIKAEIP